MKAVQSFPPSLGFALWSSWFNIWIMLTRVSAVSKHESRRGPMTLFFCCCCMERRRADCQVKTGIAKCGRHVNCILCSDCVSSYMSVCCEAGWLRWVGIDVPCDLPWVNPDPCVASPVPYLGLFNSQQRNSPDVSTEKLWEVTVCCSELEVVTLNWRPSFKPNSRLFCVKPKTRQTNV